MSKTNTGGFERLKQALLSASTWVKSLVSRGDYTVADEISESIRAFRSYGEAGVYDPTVSLQLLATANDIGRRLDCTHLQTAADQAKREILRNRRVLTPVTLTSRA